MTVWTAYSQVGIKEDVADTISNISPTKTPFQTMIGSRKVDNKLFNWQEDTLRAVGSNARVEGADYSDGTIVATVLRTNYTQILSETINISGTSEAIAHYGRASEAAMQMAKSAAQVKRDLEHAYVGLASTVVVGDSSTARVMAGYQQQLYNGGSAVLDADDKVLYTGAAGTLPTEANVLSVLTNLFNEGAEPDTIMVTPTNSLVVCDFAKAAGRYRDYQTGTKIVNKVDIYVSPFGEQKVVLNRFLKSTNTLIFEADMWQKAVLRPWFRDVLAKTGDAKRQAITGEYSLVHKNKSASAAIVQAAGPTGF